MKLNRIAWLIFTCLAAFFLPLSGRADSVNQAFEVARGAVSPAIQTKVVSIYGTGTPTFIQKWYIIFYDGGVPSHGRAVLVVDNQVVKTYAANGGATYRADLTFDPARLTPEGPALTAAQSFAARHSINYDGVRALLKQTSLDRPFRWRIELMNSGRSRGYVYVNALDSTVAAYAPPESGGQGGTYTSTTTTTTTTSTSENDGGVEGEARGFGNDVKRTFLGIGGDLQEFFTGERTVDKDDGN
jgi:hypothetical protein